VLPDHIFTALNRLTVRTYNARHLGKLQRDPKDPKRYLCRWCHGSVPRGKKTWCSTLCIESFQLISDPRLVEAAILKRDSSKCQLCGVDVTVLQEQLNALAAMIREAGHLARGYKWVSNSRPFERVEADGKRLQELDALIAVEAERHPHLFTLSRRVRNVLTGWNEPRTKLRALQRPELKKAHAYEIDHILPLSLGGSSLPHNLRTLCIHCHKVETGNGAARLAKQRRSEKRHG
jgi:5-methylcytosine-specific restriction endonuclease McrA